MSLINIPIFAFQGVFIGNAGASAVLTQMAEVRTNGAALTETMPTDYRQVLNNRIQSDNHSFNVVLSFYSDDPLTAKVSRGQSITAPYINTAPGNQQYALLLVDPEGTDSFYFPSLSTIKTRGLNYDKNKPTVTEITFRCENRNPNVTLFYQDTISSLITIMGSQSPF